MRAPLKESEKTKLQIDFLMTLSECMVKHVQLERKRQKLVKEQAQVMQRITDAQEKLWSAGAHTQEPEEYRMKCEKEVDPEKFSMRFIPEEVVLHIAWGDEMRPYIQIEDPKTYLKPFSDFSY